MGLGRLVSLDKGRFIGQQALARERDAGTRRQVVGLQVDWTDVERIYEKAGLRAAVGATASTGRGARVPRWPPGRAGDDDDLVAGAEADDRAGDDRASALR